MEFPGVLKKKHVKIPGVNQLKKKWNFQGCSKKTHVFGISIALVVFDLWISSVESFLSPEFLKESDKY